MTHSFALLTGILVAFVLIVIMTLLSIAGLAYLRNKKTRYNAPRIPDVETSPYADASSPRRVSMSELYKPSRCAVVFTITPPTPAKKPRRQQREHLRWPSDTVSESESEADR
ncbi:hypothetical protein PLICRDRAFT_42023 [Plicaturopsis crispa FD-325 SS-3]|nr:hypothetical protein PLICRDRAFT_42023 [Plicaturopsis crispa FD-325 SS-3]